MNNEEVFKENMKLAYKVANKYKIKNPNEAEDIQQVAFVGLWKAIINYNGKFKLSTFAWKVIENEILLYFRKNKNNPKTIPIEELPKEITGGVEIESIDLIDRLEKKLTKREKTVFKGIIKGMTQAQIAKRLKVTQPAISRCVTSIKEKIKEGA